MPFEAKLMLIILRGSLLDAVKSLECDCLLPVVLVGCLCVFVSVCLSAGRWWVVLCHLCGPGQSPGEGHKSVALLPLPPSFASLCSSGRAGRSSVAAPRVSFVFFWLIMFCWDILLVNKSVHFLFYPYIIVFVLPRAGSWQETCRLETETMRTVSKSLETVLETKTAFASC